MPHAGLRVVLVAIHALAGAVLVLRIVALTYAARSAELAGRDDVLLAIRTQNALLVAPLVLLIVAVAGLWLGRRWGWRFAVLADLILATFVAVDWFFGGQRVDHAPAFVFLLLLLGLLMLPWVRCLYGIGASGRR